MRRTIFVLLIISLCVGSICSCEREVDPRQMLSDFISAYGAEGVIYSPDANEGEDGYIPKELAERIYIHSGELPDDFAIFLNSRPDYGYECAVFLCEDAESLLMMEEACIERTRLLDGGGERRLIIVSGKTIFYSTMKDKERAEKIWREIIR